MRHLSVLVSVFSCLALVACEHGIDMHGTVTIPVEAQGRYGPVPEQLLVEATVPHVGVLFDTQLICETSDRPLVIHVDSFDFGCVKPATAVVRAWTRPVEVCDPQVRPPPGVEFETARARAQIEVPVKVIDSLGACNDGRLEFELTLAPVE